MSFDARMSDSEQFDRLDLKGAAKLGTQNQNVKAGPFAVLLLFVSADARLTGIQAVSGIQFLHERSPPVAHRDVKSMNFLGTARARLAFPRRVTLAVDASYHVVVADFGTSEALETEANRHAARWGTLNWMPPEVFNGQIYDTKSDIFSFGESTAEPLFCKLSAGMVLWELLTGLIPFGEIPNPLQVCRPFVLQHVRRMNGGAGAAAD